MLKIVAKVQVPTDQKRAFIEKAGELVRQCEANEPATLGIEWFMNDENEAVVIDTYEDSDAFLAHVANVGSLAMAISEIAPSSETLVFGSPNAAVTDMLSKIGAKIFPALAGFCR